MVMTTGAGRAICPERERGWLRSITPKCGASRSMRLSVLASWINIPFKASYALYALLRFSRHDNRDRCQEPGRSMAASNLSLAVVLSK